MMFGSAKRLGKTDALMIKRHESWDVAMKSMSVKEVAPKRAEDEGTSLAI